MSSDSSTQDSAVLLYFHPLFSLELRPSQDRVFVKLQMPSGPAAAFCLVARPASAALDQLDENREAIRESEGHIIDEH